MRGLIRLLQTVLKGFARGLERRAAEQTAVQSTEKIVESGARVAKRERLAVPNSILRTQRTIERVFDDALGGASRTRPTGMKALEHVRQEATRSPGGRILDAIRSEDSRDLRISPDRAFRAAQKRAALARGAEANVDTVEARSAAAALTRAAATSGVLNSPGVESDKKRATGEFPLSHLFSLFAYDPNEPAGFWARGVYRRRKFIDIVKGMVPGSVAERIPYLDSESDWMAVNPARVPMTAPQTVASPNKTCPPKVGRPTSSSLQEWGQYTAYQGSLSDPDCQTAAAPEKSPSAPKVSHRRRSVGSQQIKEPVTRETDRLPRHP
jgi:hypothetical protein